MSKCLLDIKYDIIDKARELAMGPENGFKYILGQRDALRIVDSRIAEQAAKKVNDEFGEMIITPSVGDRTSYFISPSEALVEEYFDEYKREFVSEGFDIAYAEQQRAEYTEDHRGEYFQKAGDEDTVSSTAAPETLARVKEFLKRIGVDIKTVSDIYINGIKKDANGVALIAQNLIQVVEGTEGKSLTEEALHFAVELIEQKNPQLFNQLLKEVNSYQLYNKVLADYATDPNYQTKDGKPDIRKLKKEAIAKVLVETIIKQNEGSTEKPELLAKAESWWDTILNALKALFNKSGMDTAAMKILTGEFEGTAAELRGQEGNVYFQQAGSQQSKVVDKLKDVDGRLTKKEVEVNGIKQERYILDGINTVLRRVHDSINTWYENRMGAKELTKTEFQKAIDDLKAEKGTAGHADFDYLIRGNRDGRGGILVDANGKRRAQPLNDDSYVSQISPDDKSMYKLLRDNLWERLKQFDPDTIFLSEMQIYDPKTDKAGTIDLLAITPEGKVSIFDWKFMNLNTERYEDVPWFKIAAWQQQMNQYKAMLQNAYGIKSEDFEQTRMIPIIANYSKSSARDNIMPKLLSIQIGDANVQNIKESYLLPVGVESEKTGNVEVDALLEKLNSLYKNLSSKKALPGEKLSKATQLNALFTAIRQLQMKQNVEPLIEQAVILNKQISQLIDSYKNDWKGKNPIFMSNKSINTFSEDINTALDSLEGTYATLSLDLESLFMGTLSEKDQKLQDRLAKTSSDAQRLLNNLQKIAGEFTQDIIAKKEDINKFLSPEKIIKGLPKLFSTTATLQLKSMEWLYKKSNKAFAYGGMDTTTEIKRLQEYQKKYEDLVKSKGLTIKNQFDLIKKKNSNELIDEFNPNFYKTLKSKIAAKDDEAFEWIRENVDINEVKKKLEERKQQVIDHINSKHRGGTDEQNVRDKARELAEANSLYTIATQTSPGWLLYDVVNKPLRSKWESEEWKELNKPENRAAKDFYDYILERNKFFESIGYIDSAKSRTFLPWVAKGIIEKMIFGGNVTIGEQFLRNISVGEGDIGYGVRNPETGELISSIPKYFTKDTGLEASTDLFRTMALMNEMAIKFQYVSEIEHQARLVHRVEKNKKAMDTSIFGVTKYKDGNPEYISDNSENAKLYKDQMDAIIFGQKYIQNENFDQILGSLGNFGAKLNQKLNTTIFPENLKGRQISLNKSIDWISNAFQLKTLGLNPFSSISTMLGGSFQSVINAGTYYSKQDFVSTEFELASMFNGKDAKKYVGALEYFLPLTEDYNKELAKTLSLSKFSQENLQELLMSWMRNGDKVVQLANFFSFLKNSIVENGEVVNAREFLKASDKYSKMYDVSSEERIKLRDEFEEDVAKLVEEKGVLKLSTVENGVFAIPGIEQKSDSVIKIRRKVQQLTKDALGNLSPDDVRRISMTMQGKSFMMFKNWIPRLVDVRAGNLKYNAAYEAYEWGRTRMLFRMLTTDLGSSVDSLISTFKGEGDGKWVDQMRNMYDTKKAEYEKDTGKELRMTEAQFMDLVRGNIRNQITDLIFYATLTSMFLAAKALAPDEPDDDIATKNKYKYMMRLIDKVRDEIAYFYDPTSLMSLTTSGIFPATSYLVNFKKILSNFFTEMYAIGVGDAELEKKNQVVKYILKGFPIASQADGIMLMFFPDVAKDLGMKAQSQSKPIGQ